MKKFKLFTIIAVVSLLLLNSCNFIPGNLDQGNLDADNSKNDENDDYLISGSPGIGYDYFCDCGIPIKIPEVQIHGLPLDVCTAYTAQNIKIRLDKSDTYSQLVLTNIDVITDSFDYSSDVTLDGFTWTSSKICEFIFTLKDGAAPTGEIEIIATSNWWEDHEVCYFNLTDTRIKKIFYATDDTRIAFSMISVEDAMQKLN